MMNNFNKSDVSQIAYAEDLLGVKYPVNMYIYLYIDMLFILNMYIYIIHM